MIARSVLNQLNNPEFPRLDMKRCFRDSVFEIIKAKPETTYDNFARDFGERFVPGYKAQSSVDFLIERTVPGISGH